jgi:hypothetical protein
MPECDPDAGLRLDAGLREASRAGEKKVTNSVAKSIADRGPLGPFIDRLMSADLYLKSRR